MRAPLPPTQSDCTLHWTLPAAFSALPSIVEVEYMQRQCCAEFRLHSRFYQAGPRGQPEYQHSFGGVRQASIHEKYSSCNTKECVCRVFQVLRWSAHLRSIPRWHADLGECNVSLISTLPAFHTSIKQCCQIFRRNMCLRGDYFSSWLEMLQRGWRLQWSAFLFQEAISLITNYLLHHLLPLLLLHLLLLLLLLHLHLLPLLLLFLLLLLLLPLVLIRRVCLVWRLPLGTRICSAAIFHNFAPSFSSFSPCSACWISSSSISLLKTQILLFRSALLLIL